MMDWVLSLVVLAALALLAGAFVLFRRGETRQAGLMVLLAIVMLVNVAIWVVPDSSGTAPVEQVPPTAPEGTDQRI
jgi:hypothetical protein